MNSTVKRYGFVLTGVIALLLSACSVDNKNIPDPGGNINVDTTGTIGSFYLNVSGDTSYVLNIVAVDTVAQDSFGVAGADVTTRDEILFSTAKAEPGIYYTEQSPPGITGAVFIFRKKISLGYRNYPMFHGKIELTSVNTTSGVVRGTIDVNNKYVTTADRYIRLTGTFILKLRV
jgi:hypothetical protein